MGNTAADVISYASRQVGHKGRPNSYTREYAAAHGNAYLDAAWCDMFVTAVARHVNATGVLPKGDEAYTPKHANDFADEGVWHTGTLSNVKSLAKKGMVVFFDWGLSDTRSKIDHVGYILRNNGDGTVDTVEGNTGSNDVALRVRSYTTIAGFGACKYTAPAPLTPLTGHAWPYKSSTLMEMGWTDSRGVLRIQQEVNALGYKPKLVEDGDFGAKTKAGVKWLQRHYKIKDDGIVGKITWGKATA
jgi:hypothetical protein